MKKGIIRILIWLGILFGLTLLAMLIWIVVFKGSQTTESLKWFQFLQTAGTFLLPPVLCAWIWSEHHQPFTWLKMDKKVPWMHILLAIGIMICAIPAINLLADLNGQIKLPKSLDFIEHFMRQQEDTAAALTERFLQADNIGMLLINLGLMALLPALAEELTFRGTLQQIFGNRHVAIWVTAFIFSAIHMQFYGFIPRMLMGAMFGYLFVWTGNLWVPIIMHFVNNGIAVIAFYIMGNNSNADTFGAGTTWYIGVLSLLITSLGLLIFYRRTRKQ